MVLCSSWPGYQSSSATQISIRAETGTHVSVDKSRIVEDEVETVVFTSTFPADQVADIVAKLIRPLIDELDLGVGVHVVLTSFHGRGSSEPRGHQRNEEGKAEFDHLSGRSTRFSSCDEWRGLSSGLQLSRGIVVAKTRKVCWLYTSQ